MSLRSIRGVLPRGRSLTDAEWASRHRVILAILWVHVAGIPVFGVLAGAGVFHSLAEAALVGLAAVVASMATMSRRIRCASATVGLLTSSAVLVHLSGGLVEMHFHFFVMVPLVALYQDWLPFLVAISYVLLHHGIAGALDPASVYNHPAALAHPWRWAGVHAVFIAGASAVCLTTWRLNELALQRRRAAEDELRDILSVLSTTLESTADGILVVDRFGVITAFNRRFLELWRIPEEIIRSGNDDDALAFVLDQLVEPDEFLKKVRDLYDDRDAESLDEILFKDGRIFERASRPQNVGGLSAGRVWSFRDISDRKRYEDALRTSAQRDRQAAERLEALDETKNLFLTAVSHELRTPLAALKGFAHTLSEHDAVLSADRRHGLLQRMMVNAGRLENLLGGLLDLDRISRGVLEPRRHPTHMASLVRRVVQALELDRPVNFQTERVTAFVDASMVERVVENLVANAAKHTPDGTPIDISVVRVGNDVDLIVSDRGPGISDDLKQAIFEPFRQGPTPSHSPGTGIGLSLVAKFVALHGGRCWVEDRPGGGSSFHARLPDTAAEGPTIEPAALRNDPQTLAS